jgi:hypothetical protein
VNPAVLKKLIMHLGSLVECIKGFPVSKRNGLNVPEKGIIYIIRGFYPNCDGLGVFLEEVVNPQQHFVQGYMEPSWDAKSFREVQPPMNIDIENLIHETTLQPL